MKNKLTLLLCLIFISSCGGGGGAAAFALLLADLGSTSTNEDTAYTSNISASTNYNSEISYSISSPPSYGQADISSSGTIIYIPNQDYYGDDTFAIRVTAVRKDSSGQTTGSPINKTQTVNMTINPINDAPVITLLGNFDAFNDTNIIFDDLLNLNITVSDVDNSISELQFYASMEDQTVNGTHGSGVDSDYVTLDFSNLNTAGLFTMSLCVFDGYIDTCAGEIQSYFVTNKETINVDYGCDSEGLNCSQSDQHLYYLVGSPNSSAKTNYIFIGDQLTGTADSDEFRLRLAESVNLLVASDAADVVNGYFNIIVLEEVALTGVSVFDIAIGCYSDWDPNIYCIGEVDRNLITNVMPSWTVASFLTTISGRGVAQGSVNIQGLSSRTREVVMHELGHSHGFMGDEYDSGGERTFPDYYADFPMNTTTVKDPELAKWSHHIDDFNNVPGVNYDVCYNYADGSIFYRDELTYEECECYMNQYPDSEEYPGTNEDDSCKTKIGLLEGTYYGEIETYRPRWISVMWCCFLEYGKVNIEGFAVGSIMNQGFSNYKINSEEDPSYVLNNPSGLGETITFEIDAVYDETKLKLTWLVDGQEQTELENNLTATFNRPSDNSAVSYSWVVEDLTGSLIAPNDPNNPLDFYESYWEREYYYQSDPALTPLASLNPYVGSWSWYKDGGYSRDDTVDSSNEDQFLYGELCCSMGASYKINWFNYQNSSTSQSNDDSNNKSQTVVRRTPTTDKISKIFSLNLSSNNIEIKEINNDYPLKRDIKRPFINKSDIYALNFLNADKELIYQIGINDPFKAGAQHIGYEDYKEYQFDVPINNFKVVVPQEVEASYIELVRRSHDNKLIVMDLLSI
ncbi:Ig-like domain-containing protein [Gammaproteobacteria bacterium]|nr:Ig-like domain-containing protein [Gammaproteobacteria bacterium]